MWARGSVAILALVALEACPGAAGSPAVECDETGRIVSDDCEQLAKELYQRTRWKIDCAGLPASEELRGRGFVNLAMKTLEECKAVASRLQYLECQIVEVGMPDQYLALGKSGKCDAVRKQLASSPSMRGAAGGAEVKAEAGDEAAADGAMGDGAPGDEAADDGAADDKAMDDEPQAGQADEALGATGDQPVADGAGVERPVDAGGKPDDPRGQDDPGAVGGPAGDTKLSQVLAVMQRKGEAHEFPMEHMFAIIGVVAVVLGAAVLLREQILFCYRRCNKAPASVL